MPDPEIQTPDAKSAPASTEQGDQQGIVERPDWEEAIAILAKTDPAKAEALSKKIEGYDKVLTKRMTGLSQREREIAQVLKDAQTLTRPPSESKPLSSKVLDKLEQEAADASQREGIRDLRKAIREESEDKLQELEAKWEKKFQESQNHSIAAARVGLSKEIKALEEVYGADLIEKYKGDIESNSLKYPGAYSPDRWLHTVAEPDELRQALRIHLKKQVEKEKPNGAPETPKRTAPTPVTSTKPTPVSEQYKGTSPRQTKGMFDKAIGDSVKAALGKLSVGGQR